MLALIAGTVSYLKMHTLVQGHGQPGWVAALIPFSVDGMIVAASTTLLADSRSGGHGGFMPWALQTRQHVPQRDASSSRQSQRSGDRAGASRDLQRAAWQWALANQAGNGSLPSGREIALQYGRHERWGRLVKRPGAAGEFTAESGPGEPGLRLVAKPLPPAASR